MSVAKWVLAGVVAGAVGLTVAAIAGAPSSELAGWTEAVGTVGALLATSIVLDQELADRRQARADRASAQARQMRCLFREMGSGTEAGSAGDVVPYVSGTLVFQNRSERPITQLTLTVRLSGTDMAAKEVFFDVAHPDSGREVMSFRFEGAESTGGRPGGAATFTDDDDRRWKLDHRGELVSL